MRIMSEFVKRRQPAEPGSIADVLGMFTAELRFYREIAAVIGVRVPVCYRAEESDEGTLLVLEDLSAWDEGADPAEYARLLRSMHDRWRGEASIRWPWLRPIDAGEDEIIDLWRRTWPRIADHSGLTQRARDLGGRLDGWSTPTPTGPTTLCHGDASARNARTSPDGEVALLDWEDVNAGYAADDLVWMLVSSVDPDRWDETLAAYGPVDGLDDAWPESVRQGMFSVSDDPDGPGAEAWFARIDEACRRVA
jgi:hypothetical protein